MPQYPDIDIEVGASKRSTVSLRGRAVKALVAAGHEDEALELSRALIAAPSYFRALALCREVLTVRLVGGTHTRGSMRKGS